MVRGSTRKSASHRAGSLHFQRISRRSGDSPLIAPALFDSTSFVGFALGAYFHRPLLPLPNHFCYQRQGHHLYCIQSLGNWRLAAEMEFVAIVVVPPFIRIGVKPHRCHHHRHQPLAEVVLCLHHRLSDSHRLSVVNRIFP